MAFPHYFVAYAWEAVENLYFLCILMNCPFLTVLLTCNVLFLPLRYLLKGCVSLDLFKFIIISYVSCMETQDPCRPGVKNAVQLCQKAGVKVSILCLS